VKKAKGYIDRSETFDEFLAKDGLLAETEDAALKEIIADQIKVAMKPVGRNSVKAYCALQGSFTAATPASPDPVRIRSDQTDSSFKKGGCAGQVRA
jgi:hypothetical protein